MKTYLTSILFLASFTLAKSIDLKTEIKINATPAQVWAVLTDFQSYPEWNPFILYLNGDVKIGNTIEAKIQPVGGDAMVFKPNVLAYTENKELRWIGKVWFSGLFDGEHSFELIDNKDGTTTLLHQEKFRGILVCFFESSLETKTKKGFELMNRKLKERVEASIAVSKNS